MSPKVSIVVPTYNVEKYIAKCLDSLCAQDSKDIIIYVIDDGSTDNSSKIAEAYSRKDARVNYLRKENGGYGSVLNFAFSIIKTEYFLICDPDDWLVQNSISTLYDEATLKNLDLVVADRFNVSSETLVAEPCSVNRGWIKIDPNTVYTKDVEKFSFLDVSPHAKLYRTKLIQGLELPENIAHTDFILYLSALAHAKRVEYIDQPLAYYLQDRQGNTATDKSMKSILSHLAVWNETYNKVDSPYLNLRLLNELKMVIMLASNSVSLDIKDKFIEATEKMRGRKTQLKYTVNDISWKRRCDLGLFMSLPSSAYVEAHFAKNRRKHAQGED